MQILSLREKLERFSEDILMFIEKYSRSQEVVTV